MSCWCQGNKRLASEEKMREIAKKAAKMEKSVYVLFKKRMAVFGMQKREKNTRVFSSNTYIRNTKNRIIFGVHC